MVSRWHCMQTSMARSGLKRAGFTIPPLPPEATCKLPGPWQRWQSMPSGKSAGNTGSWAGASAPGGTAG